MDKLGNVEDVYNAWDIPNIQKLMVGSDNQSLIKTIDNWNNKHLINPTKTIAFIGDSYCAHLNADDPTSTGWNSWLEIVAKHFNAEILQTGFGGLGFVSSFFNAHTKHPGLGAETILDRADIIIACVSAPDRLPTRTAYSISPHSMYSKMNSRLNSFYDQKALNRQGIDIYSKKIFKAGKAYYDYLFLGNFHYIAQKGAIRELDDLIRANQTIIWLPCFKESMCDYKPKNGAIGDLVLFEIFKNETNALHPGVTLETKVDYKFRDGPNMANHMCRKSNEKLAGYLIDYIANKKQYQIAGKNQIPITEILREYHHEEN